MYPSRAGFIVASVVGIAAITGGVLRAAGTLPPPVTPPSPYPQHQTNPSVPHPEASPAPFIIPAPSFAGKVIRWTQTDYVTVPNSLDPASGKLRNVDVWARVGQDNRVAMLRSHATFADGSFYQELIATPTAQSLYPGAAYFPVIAHLAGGSPNCPVQLSAPRLDPMLPLFANTSTLPTLRFSVTTGTTLPPATPSLSSVQPSIIYPTNPSASIWARSSSENGTTNSDQVQVYPKTGRIIMIDSRMVAASDGAINETRMVYGDLNVYDATQVPATVFNPSTEAQGACHA